MPLKLADAAVYLITDDKGLKEGLDKAEGTVEAGAGKMGGIFKGALTTALGVGIFSIAQNAVQGLAGLVTDGIGDAREAIKIAKQTEQVIKSTGKAAGLSAEEISEMAGALSEVTNFEDDAIQAGENMLLTFTNVGKDVFPQATETMLDMSQALGTDLNGAAMQLGKALNDPIKGIGALSRVGVSFTAEQKEMIKAMVEVGDTAGAQKVILDELAKEFGGQARAQVDPIIQLQNAWGNLKETLGGAVLPVINSLAQAALPYLMGAVEAIGRGVTEFFTLIDEGWGKLGALKFAIYEAFGDNRIATAISNVIEFVQNLMQVVRALWTGEGVFEDAPAWVSALVNAGEKVKTFWAENAPKVIQIVQDTYNRVKDVVLYWLMRVDAVVDQYLGVVEERWNSHQSVVVGVAQTMYDQAMGLYWKFMGDTYRFLERDTGMLGRLWDKYGVDIIGQVGELYRNVMDITGYALVGLGVLTQEQLEANKGDWYDWSGVLQTIMHNLWQLLATLVEDGLSLILAQVAAGLFALNGRFVDAGAEIADTFVTMWHAVAEIFSTAIDNWIEIITAMDWAQVGKDIMRGIALGMAQGVTWITDAAKSAYQAARSALGINSPSKLAAEGIGVPLAQGIGVGMQEEMARMSSGFMSGLNGLISGLGNQAAPGPSVAITVNVSGGDAAGVGAAARDGLLDAMRSLGF
jgi:hypothetical protein